MSSPTGLPLNLGSQTLSRHDFDNVMLQRVLYKTTQYKLMGGIATLQAMLVSEPYLIISLPCNLDQVTRLF